MSGRVTPLEIEIPCRRHAEGTIDVVLVPGQRVVPEKIEPPEVPAPGCPPQLLRKVRLPADIPRVLTRSSVANDLNDVGELR